MKTLINTTLAGVAILAMMPASAVTLTEPPMGTSQDFALPGTSVAARPELAGLVLEDTISSFSVSGAGESISGEVQNRVVRSDDGTVDFYWRVMVNDGLGDLSAFRVSGFSGYDLDADWRTDSIGDVSPTTARYFGSASGSVNFLFDDEVGVGQSSFFFFLDTQATAYDMTGEFDVLCAIDGCISGTYSTFAPSIVPVPAAAWLFGSGLLGLLGVARRKRNTASRPAR